MAICKFCGEKINEGANFCRKCGKAQNTAGNYNSAPVDYNLSAYSSSDKHFSFMGRNIDVPASMDAYNYYRKSFKVLARDAALKLRREYGASISGIDAFLISFDQLYIKHREPLIRSAVSLLSQLGIYDVTVESFSKRHTVDYCLIAEDISNMADAFEKTVAANQGRIGRLFDLVPGVIFQGGFGAVIKAGIFNAAMDTAAEAAIMNAKVKPKQKIELFNMINTDNLMKRAYTDYWNVYLTLINVLREHGTVIWSSTDSAIIGANNIVTNLISGGIPTDRVPDVFVELLKTYPYNSDCFVYMNSKYGGNTELQALADYFGFAEA